MQVIFETILYRARTRRLANYFRVFLILPFIILIGCVNTPTSELLGSDTGQPKDVVAELNPDQLEAPTAAELALDPDLPKRELDAPTLEKLLLANLASFNGDWAMAGDSAASVAKDIRDYRLARLATMLSLRNDDYSAAASNADLWAELKPDSVDAQNMRILSLTGSGQTDDAISAINQGIRHQNI